MVTARQALADIVDGLRQYSEQSAVIWGDRITSKADLAGVFPWSHREVPEVASPFIGEVFEKPYRIWFRILDDEIEIMVSFTDLGRCRTDGIHGRPATLRTRESAPP